MLEPNQPAKNKVITFITAPKTLACSGVLLLALTFVYGYFLVYDAEWYAFNYSLYVARIQRMQLRCIVLMGFVCCLWLLATIRWRMSKTAD